jgi:hypothetical protein
LLLISCGLRATLTHVAEEWGVSRRQIPIDENFGDQLVLRLSLRKMLATIAIVTVMKTMDEPTMTHMMGKPWASPVAPVSAVVTSGPSQLRANSLSISELIVSPREYQSNTLSNLFAMGKVRP